MPSQCEAINHLEPSALTPALKLFNDERESESVRLSGEHSYDEACFDNVIRTFDAEKEYEMI